MKVDGYRVLGRDGTAIALYVPEFHHIWTNPGCRKSAIEAALSEEFIHATQTASRSAELLPLRNYLTGMSRHPRHAEFRDIVEGVFLAVRPLAFEKEIDLAQLRGAGNPHRDVAAQIIEVAVQVARSATPDLSEPEAKRRALWGVILTLLSCVPRAPNQATRILTHLRLFQPARPWTTARELLPQLLVHLTTALKTTQPQNRRFTLVRPNDSHTLLFHAVDMMNDAWQTSSDRLVPAMPALLSLLTMQIYRVVHLIWQQQSRSRVRVGIEVWPFTVANIAATYQAFSSQGPTGITGSTAATACAARTVHVNWLTFLEGIFRRRRQPSLAYLMHEAVELSPYLLRELVLSKSHRGHACPGCHDLLSDPVFLTRVESLATLPTAQKVRMVRAASQYDQWLRGDCLRMARATFAVPARIRSRPPVCLIRQESTLADTAPTTFCCAGRSNRPLAQFLPALGQIWILPGCSDQLLTQIQAHEVQHHNDCSLQPAQLLHLRHFLLDRPLPEPFRFHDLIEASYVLGLTIAAGFGPDVRRFPPAPESTRQLATQMARQAVRLAKGAAAAVPIEVARREAAHALLFLLHHVIPSRAGLGQRVLHEVSQLTPVSTWRDRSELWATLHLQLQNRLTAEGHAAPFQLALPIDPHRSVGEMLVFLAHCVQPIPERRETVLKALPSLVSLLSFGSITCIPVVRVTRAGRTHHADLAVLHADDVSEQAVRKTAAMQEALARRWRKEGINCICTQYVADLFNRTQGFRVSSRPDRIRRFLAWVLDDLPARRFLRHRYTCRACQENLQSPTVREASETIALNLPAARDFLVRLPDRYESWLASGCIGMLQHAHGLSGRISARKRYSFL